MIEQERIDREQYHTDKLTPIRAQVEGITKGLVVERKNRVINEKKII
jgi:hypothetical protein